MWAQKTLEMWKQTCECRSTWWEVQTVVQKQRLSHLGVAYWPTGWKMASMWNKTEMTIKFQWLSLRSTHLCLRPPVRVKHVWPDFFPLVITSLLPVPYFAIYSLIFLILFCFDPFFYNTYMFSLPSYGRNLIIYPMQNHTHLTLLWRVFFSFICPSLLPSISSSSFILLSLCSLLLFLYWSINRMFGNDTSLKLSTFVCVNSFPEMHVWRTI